jgi:glyceraldehyde 3-phosphate dehydrogenase
MVVKGNQLKLYVWYDNEWAMQLNQANRTAELARMVGRLDKA